jgi:hypothetical protein
MQQLSLSVALGVMASISSAVSADFDAIGITPEDYKLVTAETPWGRGNRKKVTTTLEALMYGTIDQIGLARFTIPSEYVAAVVATFVAPINRQVACAFIAEAGKTGARAMDLAAQGLQAQTVDSTTPSQLFALVCQLTDTGADSEGRKAFESRMAARLRKAAVA